MLKHASLALFAIASIPATAQTPQPQTQPAANATKSNPLDRVVCKTEDSLGTRLGAHRVCATVREWQEQEEQNRQAAQAMQGMGAGCSERASGGTGCNFETKPQW